MNKPATANEIRTFLADQIASRAPGSVFAVQTANLRAFDRLGTDEHRVSLDCHHSMMDAADAETETFFIERCVYSITCDRALAIAIGDHYYVERRREAAPVAFGK